MNLVLVNPEKGKGVLRRCVLVGVFQKHSINRGSICIYCQELAYVIVEAEDSPNM